MSPPITLIHERFRQMAERFPDRDFVATPPNPERHYAPAGVTRTYADAARHVDALQTIYAGAGLGHGHRVALQVENHPDFYLHRMALHRLGTTLVPLNQDHVAKEIQHVFQVTRPELAITFDRHRPRIEQAAAAMGSAGPRVVQLDTDARFTGDLPGVRTLAPATGAIDETTETTILFTSGTTGHPKGCRFTHGYESMACDWYRTRGGHVTYTDGVERMYSPLPLHHSNTGVHAFLEMLATGGCLVTSDRFRSNRYWQEVKDARATCIHYLGVIMAMLFQMPVTEEERTHTIRFGLGAGLEPSLHRKFEERFGFPLVELWGMTEIMRFLCDSREPRKVGTRAFGRSEPGLEAKLVDDNEQDVGDDTPGELVVRHSAATPRAGFFDGYLGEPEATEHGWRGGWFHTGDVAVRDPDGCFHFVDRKKHIIRRAGQNIAAAEVETVILSHAAVREVAAVAVKDEIREEEIFLCVVPHEGQPNDRAQAEAIFDHAIANLAHYKAPGFLLFVDTIPRTASQKMMKYALFAEGVDPRALPGVHDLRERKKQAAAGARARS
jgi:acyl-CoA synthetase (AMP-forming)/AMP-acid ligase II